MTGHHRPGKATILKIFAFVFALFSKKKFHHFKTITCIKPKMYYQSAIYNVDP